MLQHTAAKTTKENKTMSTQEIQTEAPIEVPTMLDTLMNGWTAQLDEQIEKLQPFVDEYEQAQEAKARLTGQNFRPSRARSARPAERLRSEHTGSRGRPRGSGKRSQEVIDLISAEGGKTVSEVAESLDVKPNYLYRVMPDLVKAGQLAKEGSKFVLATNDTADAA